MTSRRHNDSTPSFSYGQRRPRGLIGDVRHMNGAHRTARPTFTQGFEWPVRSPVRTPLGCPDPDTYNLRKDPRRFTWTCGQEADSDARDR